MARPNSPIPLRQLLFSFLVSLSIVGLALSLSGRLLSMHRLCRLSGKMRTQNSFNCHSIKCLRSFSLGARKSKEEEDVEKYFENPPPGWVTVKWGDEKEREKINMAERVKDAEQWVSMQLSDEDAKFLNEKLGFDEAILSDDEDEPKQKKAPKKRLSLIPLPTETDIKLRNLRGFLQINPFICSGCGSSFQTKNEENPGFLPSDKFKEHREKAGVIKEKQEAIKILEIAEIELDSPAAEEYLRMAKTPEAVIRGVRKIGEQLRGLTSRSAPALSTDSPPSDSSEEEGLEEKICICQRCFRLQQYGQVPNSLRPGWSENDLLTPEHFQSLLTPIQKAKTIVLSIVDIFDLQGSILNNLKEIAGDNPVVIAINKIDLLPTDISETRVLSFIYDEIRRKTGLLSPSEHEDMQYNKGYRKSVYRDREDKDVMGQGVLRRGDVKLISCQTGYGVEKLMSHVLGIARDYGSSIHVLGAANSGKSSFINRLLTPAPNARTRKNSTPLVTVSPLPGTTLDFLRIKLPNGVIVIDTPGLLPPGHLTAKLTPPELSQVLPTKPIKPLTLRVEPNKTVLLGGLASIELTEGKPVFFTLFVSPLIKIHCTDKERVSEFLGKHMGKLVSPPVSYERYEAIGPYESKVFDLEGKGWKEADYDIVLPGVGWVAITGPGAMKVTVTAPVGTNVSVRPALLPYEAKYSTAKFTGGRIAQKSGKDSKQTGRWRKVGKP